MSALFNTLASSTGLVQCLVDLATWVLARTLQMPEPMVHAAATLLLMQVRAIESCVGKKLCPVRLARRLLWWG